MTYKISFASIGISLLGLISACDRAAPSPDAATPAAAASPNSPARTAHAAAALAQVPPTATFSGPPNIMFDATTVNLGTFSEVEQRNARFTFTNAGGQPLIIEQVKTSCSCTSAKLAKREYQPGERGHIDITYAPTAPGNEPRIVNVITNAPQPPPDDFVRLHIRANVLAFLDVQPRMLETGVVTYRRQHRFAVSVTCPPDEGFVIESVVTSNPNVVAVARPSSGHEKSRTIDVTIGPGATWGSLFSWLEITARGRPSAGSAPVTHTSKIRIQGQVFGQLRAVPDSFRFGAKPGEQFQRSIRLSRTNNESFELLSVTVQSSDLPGTAVARRQLTPSEYELTITATGDKIRSKADGIIALRTNVPGEEQIEIPILGVIRIDNPSVR